MIAAIAALSLMVVLGGIPRNHNLLVANITAHMATWIETRDYMNSESYMYIN